MPYSVAIVGGGWYGCHIALSLHNLGFEVQLYEKSGRLLNDASGNNQFRLHMGFHYARHQQTRQQSRDGYFRFLERYPELSAPIAQNVYAIPHGQSLIDFPTYKLIMSSSGMDFVESAQPIPGLVDIEGALLVPERVILLSEARALFSQRLASIMTLDTAIETIEEREDEVVVNGRGFDFVIDATWGHLTRPAIDCIYEPTMLLYYEAADRFPAITLVDGPLCSVYPTEDPHVYTLSSVPHTPLGQVRDPAAAIALRDGVTGETVQAKRAAMEAQIMRNLPGFRDHFGFLGIQLSIKTKPTGAADDRSCYVERRGRRFIVMSGKIDTIFHATERILGEIATGRLDTHRPSEALIRNDILRAPGEGA